MSGGGSKPGERRGGKQLGSKNKATIEREREAQLAVERERLLLEARAAEGDRALRGAVAQGRKLMKELGFDLTQLAAGLAAFYQPHPQWQQDPASGKLVNANPNFDEPKFRYYLEMAMQGARDFASYESPKLSAMLVGSAVVNEIEVVGGLPDDQDGGLIDDAATHAAGDAARAAGPATDVLEGSGGTPDIPPAAGGAVPDAGQAQGGPVRKAMG